MKTPREITEELLKNGAILNLGLATGIRILIGHWEWIDDHQVFYFDAGSSDEFGGHLLNFDRTEVPHDLAVAFNDEQGKILAYLTTREEADLDDPNAYAIGWIHWQEVAASMLPFIQEVKANLTREED